MTPEEARVLVGNILYQSNIGDDEAAHSLEDDLYHRFVRAIATMASENGAYTWFDVVDAISAAEVILETESMKFFRWRA